MKPSRDSFKSSHWDNLEIIKLDHGCEIRNYTAAGKICSVGFSGKRQKPDFHYIFPTVERRIQFTSKWYAEIVEKEESKAEARKAKAEKRKAFKNPFKIGDILYEMWGYEQTNVDFYQVVEVKPKSIIIGAIASKVTETGFMSGTTTPVKDSFLNDKRKSKVVQSYGANGEDRYYITMTSYSSAYLWAGKPMRCSWYH